WKADVPALSKLASEQVLEPTTFSGLPENNKFIVVALLRHVVDSLNKHYIRKEPAEHFDMWQFRINHPILYLSTEALWDQLLQLASATGANGAMTDPAARELSDFLENGIQTGELVSGSRLEQCLEHGQAYFEDLTVTTGRCPMLDMSDLDSDHMHAFLCAYATCFRS
ncbi:MAG TPA: hypothetical protein VFP64_20930, partial [Pyrinomonadaceae bacterium]|nr:hypothetical protein [Pyrinomonadaceae bacterium]